MTIDPELYEEPSGMFLDDRPQSSGLVRSANNGYAAYDIKLVAQIVAYLSGEIELLSQTRFIVVAAKWVRSS